MNYEKSDSNPFSAGQESGNFKIRAYLKVELAQLYFVDLSLESALRKLRRWINHNPDLHRELYEMGPEGKNDQSFSKRQVEVLVKYLECP